MLALLLFACWLCTGSAKRGGGYHDVCQDTGDKCHCMVTVHNASDPTCTGVWNVDSLWLFEKPSENPCVSWMFGRQNLSFANVSDCNGDAATLRLYTQYSNCTGKYITLHDEDCYALALPKNHTYHLEVTCGPPASCKTLHIVAWLVIGGILLCILTCAGAGITWCCVNKRRNQRLSDAAWAESYREMKEQGKVGPPAM
eukprot:TRINITY_DN21099_c0_g1_i1.p1 TRINITY_DN21099_c0_g1~~TRINITY_DN21099_c0_g1_i1.p1  ORF type:complete len:199 (+),score=2.12 TRINITY_DN21099_c0_g1_i1:296-892(+)